MGSIENENKNENENENESGDSLSADIRLRRGNNEGPQEGTVTGFHILR